MDPNDPRNAEILELKQLLLSLYDDPSMDFSTLKDYWSLRENFRLEMPSWLKRAITGLGSNAELKHLKRPNLLLSRYKKSVPSKRIPILEQEVRESDFLPKSNQGVFGSKLNIGHELSDMIGFVKRVRYHQLINKARLAVPPTVDDYVREERLPPAAPQSSILDLLFPIYRPLNPTRLERKSLIAASPESCKIIVQVLRGFNLPSRVTKITKEKQDSDVDPTVCILSFLY
jgi:coiled-coil and C2 domain-containing protein 2A